MRNAIIRLLAAWTITSSAQPTLIPVTDTLHYFFNKQYFIQGSTLGKLPYFKTAPATNTRVTNVGSRFTNTEFITVTGLEAIVALHNDATNLSVPYRLYLCTLQNSMPVLPALDSVELMVSGDTIFTGWAGKDFSDGKTYQLNTDFAVLMKNVSRDAGDSVRIGISAGKTATNVAKKEKFSDGFGYARYKGGFYNSVNFDLVPGFGPGTGYEFLVAPRVQYTLSVNHFPDPDATRPGAICPWEPMTFVSASSERILNRQYNLLGFAGYWGWHTGFHQNTLIPGPLTGTAPPLPQDSAVYWYFAPEDNNCKCPDPRLFPPSPGIQQVTFYTDSALRKKNGGDSVVCFVTNEYRVRFKGMASYGRGAYTIYNDTFRICASPCGIPLISGLGDKSGIDDIRVRRDGDRHYHISGTPAQCSLYLCDLTGRRIEDVSVLKEDHLVDLSAQPPGFYVLLFESAGVTRCFKLVR